MRFILCFSGVNSGWVRSCFAAYQSGPAGARSCDPRDGERILFPAGQCAAPDLQLDPHSEMGGKV